MAFLINWKSSDHTFFAKEYLDGMQLAYPGRFLQRSTDNCGVLINSHADRTRFGIIISGGAANGPLFPGYVCDGLADAAVVGGAYSAPNAYTLYEIGKELGQKEGVVYLYNNFAGDFLNNDMAIELLRLDGIRALGLPVTDDIASAIGEPKENRSGRTGIALLTKLAASCKREGLSMDDTFAMLQKAHARVATFSVSVDWSSQTVSYGGGFSGEPGIYAHPVGRMQDVADQMVERLLDELKPRADESFIVLVNRMRLASYSDSYLMVKLLHHRLNQQGKVVSIRTANYSNIIDVYGFEAVILCADEEIQGLLRGEVATDCFAI